MSEAADKASLSKVKYRRPLNSQQLKTLHLLYWYRFCTSRQLAHSLQKPSHKAIQNKLQTLEAQAFIAKRYDASYKLAGRPAEYFITPKGARELERVRPGTVNQWASKSLYKNKTVSKDFLSHCITVTEVYQRLRGIYSNSGSLYILPKSYMAQYSYYPAWTPDLHLEIPKTSHAPARHYFLDVWDGTVPFFVSVRKARNYAAFIESGDWQEDEQYPALLAVCRDERMQKKLTRQMNRIADEAWSDQLVFATTTMDRVQQASKPTDRIWTLVGAAGSGKFTTLRAVGRSRECDE